MSPDIKIVTWNCEMALRRKLQAIKSLETDILVLQECSQADSEQLESIGLKRACWIGRNPHKGLTLAARPELSLTADPIQGIEWAIRGVAVHGTSTLGIVALWACAPNRSERYIRQIHKLLDQDALMGLPPTSIVLGDFNSNTIWDGKHFERSHSRAVQKFEAKGYRSAYHDFSKEEHGKESTPTFFMHRHITRPYHIDYAFVSEHLRSRQIGIEIGTPSNWITISDHMPFTVTLHIE